MYIDTHAHLTADKFAEDQDDVITRALDADVEHIVTVGSGYGLEGNQDAIDLAGKYPQISATAGVHPCEAEIWSSSVEDRLRQWLSLPEVVAVGECGLDYAFERDSFREIQKEAFSRQCALSIEYDLPLIVHTRDAFEDTCAILKDHRIGLDIPGVIHFFTTTLEQAEAYMELGMMISVPGVVTLPNAPQLVEAVASIPLEKLMIETDSPYAAPVPKRGRRNEPAFVPYVAEKIADLHGVPVEQVARMTTANAKRFFRLADQP